MHRFCRGIGRASIFGLGACLLLCSAFPSRASAYPLLFSFSGGVNGSFGVDSNPTPNYLDATSFGAPVSGATGDFSGAGGVEFYLPSGGGGLATYAGPNNSIFIGLGGPQLFTGSLTLPVFAPGTFVLHDSGGVTSTSLTVTGPGAPAPDLGTGFLAGALALAALVFTRRFGRSTTI